MLIWGVAAAAYLLLAGGTSAHELATAALLATLTLGWRLLARRFAPRRFARAPGAAAAWARAFRHLLPATAGTARVLARVAIGGGSPGRADPVRFERGVEDAPAERARRATALLAASLAPDGFVVRAAPGRDEALVHALDAPPPAPDPRWLA